MTGRTWMALVAGMVLGGLACSGWLAQPTGTANAAATPGSSSDVIAITTDSPTGTQLLYLIDSRQQVFSVYEFDTKKSKLKLAAARGYAADHQLQEYNTESPTVADIEKLVHSR